jgi:LDH2 family malate/lactate/ureidoglycolate dehydrogenase
MTRVAPETLARFATDILRAAGTTDGQAAACTRAMMHASLHGVDTHGIRLLAYYVECLAGGFVNRNPEVRIARPRRGAVLVDADCGLGHFPSYLAMEEACAIATDLGIGMAGVKNASHFGAAGAYAIKAAENGFIGFVACNSGALVALHGGTEPFHGTNPMSFAAPLRGRDSFLLDMATSSIPWNRLLLRQAEGRGLPAGVALDGEGNATGDPAVARTLLPLGGADFGYKGAGLAGVIEILSAVLLGMNLSVEEDGFGIQESRLGYFLMAIDPETFIGRDAFERRLSDYLDAVARQAAAGAPVRAAGDAEWAERDDRRANGIPLPEGLDVELAALGDRFGVRIGG